MPVYVHKIESVDSWQTKLCSEPSRFNVWLLGFACAVFGSACCTQIQLSCVFPSVFRCYQPAFVQGTAAGDETDTPEGSLHSPGETNYPSEITLGKERNRCHETIEGNCLEFQQGLFRLLSMISKVIMELHWPVIKYRHQRSSGSATCVIEGDNCKWEQLRARAGSHGEDPGDRKDLVGELQYPQRKSVLMSEARLE